LEHFGPVVASEQSVTEASTILHLTLVFLASATMAMLKTAIRMKKVFLKDKNLS